MFVLKNVSVAAKILFMITLLLSSVQVLSQQSSTETANTESENNTNNDSSSNSESANNTAESKPKPQERVFKPSEEISEDSPVPFPVDI